MVGFPLRGYKNENQQTLHTLCPVHVLRFASTLPLLRTLSIGRLFSTRRHPVISRHPTYPITFQLIILRDYLTSKLAFARIVGRATTPPITWRYYFPHVSPERRLSSRVETSPDISSTRRGSTRNRTEYLGKATLTPSNGLFSSRRDRVSRVP